MITSPFNTLITIFLFIFAVFFRRCLIRLLFSCSSNNPFYSYSHFSESSDKSNMSKGAQIKIIGGSFAPANGWLDNSRDQSECYTALIETVTKGGSKKEKVTKVLHDNYVLRTALKPPINYEGAMMDQLPKVNILMKKMVKKRRNVNWS